MNNQYCGACFREITRMKQAKGIGGKSGADNEDDLQVVPLESTSEYEKQLFQVFSW